MIPQIFFFLVIGYAILYLFNVAGRLDQTYKITTDTKIDDLQHQLRDEIDRMYQGKDERKDMKEYRRLMRMVTAFRWSRDVSYIIQLTNHPSVKENPELQKRAYALINLAA